MVTTERVIRHQPPPTYVKGFNIDRDKVAKLLNLPDPMDNRVDWAARKIMKNIQCDLLVVGEDSEGQSEMVIMASPDAQSYDIREVEDMEVEDMRPGWDAVLSGPSVFKVTMW